MKPPDGLNLRRWENRDSIAEITELLHAAYRPLADMGLRFVATHQDERTTAERLAKGEAYVGELEGRLVATLTLYRPGSHPGTPWYERPEVFHFGQFAVEPKLQKQGVGAALMDLIERRAAELGATELALDTSERATHLIHYYERRGYRKVGTARWVEVNYGSVILSKTLPIASYRISAPQETPCPQNPSLKPF